MSRVYNFSPGPAMLPDEVLKQARQELLDWNGRGMSVMEMSHRGDAFMSIAAKATMDLRELLAIPDNYQVLFLQGGATGQFAAVPMNLLGDRDQADYINTGIWSKKAISEGRKFCRVNVAATSEETGFNTIPLQQDWELDPFSAYVHYTPNETIGGVEFHWIPDTGDMPLVADMSSNILSRPVDVSKFGVIYAGAQKNIGPAGLTIVIVREDLLGHAHPGTPSIFNYKIQAENDSMYNTPSSFCWYMAGLVFDWLKRRGGLAMMAEINQRKAAKLYKVIDDSGFYENPVDPACRSWMNVPFTLHNENLDKVFLKESAQAGLVALKGHRSVGGMRASIYNAMPEAGVNALVDFMNDFETRHG